MSNLPKIRNLSGMPLHVRRNLVRAELLEIGLPVFAVVGTSVKAVCGVDTPVVAAIACGDRQLALAVRRRDRYEVLTQLPLVSDFIVEAAKIKFESGSPDDHDHITEQLYGKIGENLYATDTWWGLRRLINRVTFCYRGQASDETLVQKAAAGDFGELLEHFGWSKGSRLVLGPERDKNDTYGKSWRLSINALRAWGLSGDSDHRLNCELEALALAERRSLRPEAATLRASLVRQIKDQLSIYLPIFESLAEDPWESAHFLQKIEWLRTEEVRLLLAFGKERENDAESARTNLELTRNELVAAYILREKDLLDMLQKLVAENQGDLASNREYLSLRVKLAALVTRLAELNSRMGAERAAKRLLREAAEIKGDLPQAWQIVLEGAIESRLVRRCA